LLAKTRTIARGEGRQLQVLRDKATRDCLDKKQSSKHGRMCTRRSPNACVTSTLSIKNRQGYPWRSTI